MPPPVTTPNSYEIWAQRSDGVPVLEWYACSCGWVGTAFVAFSSPEQWTAHSAPEQIFQEIRDHLAQAHGVRKE